MLAGPTSACLRHPLTPIHSPIPLSPDPVPTMLHRLTLIPHTLIMHRRIPALSPSGPLIPHIRTPSPFLIILEFSVIRAPPLKAGDKRRAFGVAAGTVALFEEEQHQDYEQHQDAGACYEDYDCDCAGGGVVAGEEGGRHDWCCCLRLRGRGKRGMYGCGGSSGRIDRCGEFCACAAGLDECVYSLLTEYLGKMSRSKLSKDRVGRANVKKPSVVEDQKKIQ